MFIMSFHRKRKKGAHKSAHVISSVITTGGPKKPAPGEGSKK